MDAGVAAFWEWWKGWRWGGGRWSLGQFLKHRRRPMQTQQYSSWEIRPTLPSLEGAIVPLPKRTFPRYHQRPPSPSPHILPPWPLYQGARPGLLTAISTFQWRPRTLHQVDAKWRPLHIASPWISNHEFRGPGPLMGISPSGAKKRQQPPKYGARACRRWLYMESRCLPL